MQGTYVSWLVYLSIAVAIVVSYTALTLAARVSTAEGRRALGWMVGGAVSMGIGIWSMHFIGMLAMKLPIELTYDLPTTIVSLTAAIVTSGFALSIVGQSSTSLGRLSLGAVLMGTGICIMHYTGMAAIRIVPAVTYQPLLFSVSIVIAVVASFAALWLAFHLRSGHSWQLLLARLCAAVIMGCAISGMHYTGMAASKFGAGSYCLSGASLGNPWFAITLGVFAFGIMALTLVMSMYESDVTLHLKDRDDALEHANASARYATTHDALTGLPNRVAVGTQTEHIIREAQRSGTEFALLVLNVNRLKPINDSLGHEAGDELLRQLARRLQSLLRHGDVVGRLAGNGFVILARAVRSAEDAEAIVSKIYSAVDTPFAIRARDIHISLSGGISRFPEDGVTFDLLLRRAETAMRCAKDGARSGYLFYSAEMHNLADERLTLEVDLRGAIEHNQLELHYQPKVDISSGLVRSAEALLRWRHPTRGLIPPGTFIPVAEETGLILPIGEWVLRQACLQVRRWLDAGAAPLRVAVNLSAKQFRHDDLVAVVRSALTDARLEPGYLELELTESSVMHDPEKSAATLQRLSTMGVHISIDDFGTGYSSLSHLRSFPLDKLKIDRSFVRELESNPDDASIVKAIISLAHSLRLRVVAEGVETVEQLEFLRELGCDQYQGFFCSPAVPPEVFAKFLERLRAERVEHTEADMLRTQSRLSAYIPKRA